MYRLDATLRHAAALQRTADAPDPSVGQNQDTLDKLGLKPGEAVRVSQGGRAITLPLVLDARLPDRQAYIPGAFAETSALSGFEPITLEQG